MSWIIIEAKSIGIFSNVHWYMPCIKIGFTPDNPNTLTSIYFPM